MIMNEGKTTMNNARHKRYMAIGFVVVSAGCSLLGPATQAATVSCSAATSTEWVPSWGKAYISADAATRYIYQYVYWHSSTRTRWLANNWAATYEPDAFFYNYDGKSYADAPTGYWNSDLPAPYVDTQAFDSPNEKAITIGSALPRDVAPGLTYYTVTRFTSGGGASSLVKLSSQRGLRVPNTCYSTYCSFGCDSDNNYKTVSFQSGFYAPGCRKYNWEWTVTSNKPC